VIHRYNDIKFMSEEERGDVVPRVVFFGGKAAPDYSMGKLIIKLISDVASTINSDKSIQDLLKV
jgi:starch phosphorylase